MNEFDTTDIDTTDVDWKATAENMQVEINRLHVIISELGGTA
jgi:hypothetical protein